MSRATLEEVAAEAHVTNEKIVARLTTAEILLGMLCHACTNAGLVDAYEEVDEVVRFAERFIAGQVDSLD